MEVIKLTGEQVDEITLLATDQPYTKGGRKERGEKFRRYRYNGIVFTVEESNPFNKAFDDDRKITSVKLILSKRTVKAEDGTTSEVDSLQFDSHVSYGQEEQRLLHSIRMEGMKAIASTKNFNEEVLEALKVVPV